ncbi:MAG: hypothetical protein MI740_04135 [Halanaerobiales bacterium]|nr:hypothetical protein [Halanaerobiales bacterium]
MLNKLFKVFLLTILLLGISSGSMASIPDSAWVNIDNTSERIDYRGMWNSLIFRDSYAQTEAAAHHRAYAEFTFEGTAVRLLGSIGNRNGLAEIYLDGKLEATIDCYSSDRTAQQVLYRKDGLTKGQHTIKVVVTGRKNTAALSSFVMVDAFSYLPTLSDAIRLTEDIINRSVIGAPVPGEKLSVYYPLKAVEEAKIVLQTAGQVNNVSELAPSTEINTVAYMNRARRELEDSLVDQLFFADQTEQGANAVVDAGSPLWVKGKLGNALKLDGRNDRLIVSHRDYLSPTDQITVEAWIKADQWKNNTWEGVIVGKDGDRGGNRGYTLRTGKNGTVEFVVTTPGWTAATSEPIMETGKWYHVAGVFDSKTIKIYINGELQATTEVTQPLNFSDFDLFIGDCAAWQGRIFNGIIDEVRIWKLARSSAEIKATMNQELSGNESGLLAYWDFNQLN